MTVYGCILVENNVDEGSRLPFATGIYLMNKNNMASKARLKLSKIYCLHMKNGHSEHIFFRAREAMAPLAPLDLLVPWLCFTIDVCTP